MHQNLMIFSRLFYFTVDNQSAIITDIVSSENPELNKLKMNANCRSEGEGTRTHFQLHSLEVMVPIFYSTHRALGPEILTTFPAEPSSISLSALGISKHLMRHPCSTEVIFPVQSRVAEMGNQKIVLRSQHGSIALEWIAGSSYNCCTIYVETFTDMEHIAGIILMFKCSPV